MTADSDRASELIQRAIVCDMTIPWCGLPGDVTRQQALPARLRAAGFTFVSLTVASDTTADSALANISATRKMVLEEDESLALVESVYDIAHAKRDSKLAVGMHFQGSLPIGRDIDLVSSFYRLGIRHMLLAYNARNFVADGCHERTDGGLSLFGQRLIGEMNRVGMLVDVAHTGYTSSMEAIEASQSPVIVSHGNVWALNEHPRCYKDDQLRALARSGGVLGLTGLGIFLGNNEATVERYVTSIRYIADLVGHEHVGIGSDYVFDIDALSGHARKFADRWPATGGYTLPKVHQLEPESLTPIVEQLITSGFEDEQVLDILGRNWLRVLKQVWK